ncbi:MAG TPA: chloride channel protein [Bryobacteraceae bacterium]|nr:chloride channel protein [Bryobacteraceae bacterium]
MSETRGNHSPELGDFTATARIIPISAMAVCIGIFGGFAAWVLMRLIAIFTNLFYYGRWGTAFVSPAGNQLGWYAVLIPAAGGLIVGMMAFYGSDRIRGHGIPEALESILINGSKVQPRLAILKPLSSAIAIGSGGPFGAEGPIIVTGGAVGSVISQLFRLSAAERKTLLVAGAAAGMSATFAAPVSATLLAVELLLFEWKPRSAIPVALASAAAAATRRYILGLGPLFPVPAHAAFAGASGLAGCAAAGLLAGGLACLLTLGVYAAEDGFRKLPLHWKWWPAIGGLAVGLGGMIFPQALGVGYDTIGSLLQGDVPRATIAGVLLVKSVIWIVALSSGTSGGVLAPLLMMGAALGGVEGMLLPHLGAGFWPLVSMTAVLSGALGAPFTAALFALELTHDVNVLLPLLVASMIAHATTALLLKRSILTEKIARRGLHLSREYATDPLETLFVRDAMRTKLAALPADETVENLRSTIIRESMHRGQHLFPVVDAQQRLTGVITREELRRLTESAEGGLALGAALRTPTVAHPGESLRAVALRMAETGFTRLPVVEDDGKLTGMIAVGDLLMARAQNLKEEGAREAVLKLRLPFRNRVA